MFLASCVSEVQEDWKEESWEKGGNNLEEGKNSEIANSIKFNIWLY